MLYAFRLLTHSMLASLKPQVGPRYWHLSIVQCIEANQVVLNPPPFQLAPELLPIVRFHQLNLAPQR